MDHLRKREEEDLVSMTTMKKILLSYAQLFIGACAIILLLNACNKEQEPVTPLPSKPVTLSITLSEEPTSARVALRNKENPNYNEGTDPDSKKYLGISFLWDAGDTELVRLLFSQEGKTSAVVEATMRIYAHDATKKVYRAQLANITLPSGLDPTDATHPIYVSGVIGAKSLTADGEAEIGGVEVYPQDTKGFCPPMFFDATELILKDGELQATVSFKLLGSIIAVDLPGTDKDRVYKQMSVNSLSFQCSGTLTLPKKEGDVHTWQGTYTQEQLKYVNYEFAAPVHNIFVPKTETPTSPINHKLAYLWVHPEDINTPSPLFLYFEGDYGTGTMQYSLNIGLAKGIKSGRAYYLDISKGSIVWDGSYAP